MKTNAIHKRSYNCQFHFKDLQQRKFTFLVEVCSKLSRDDWDIESIRAGQNSEADVDHLLKRNQNSNLMLSQHFFWVSKGQNLNVYLLTYLKSVFI